MKTLLRIIHILWVFYQFGIFEILRAPSKHESKNKKAKYFFLRGRKKNELYGVRLRKALVILGPVFIKFGQLLSTRRDMLEDEIINELAILQDNVPPFSEEEVKKTLEREYGRDIDNIFSSFSYTAIASASIAQVHRAHITDGTKVAVKIIRPNIRKQINQDVKLLHFLATIINIFYYDSKRLRTHELVDEFARALESEMDLINEAANAVQFHRLFERSDQLFVPQVYWSYCTSSIIVMDWVEGISIRNKSLLKIHGIDTKKLAATGVEIFFTQVFRDGFFHADMHPGNIFILNDGRYAAVDFGIVGTLSEVDKNYLAENFVAFFNRDYRRVAMAHIEAGWAPPETRVDIFESAIRTVCEPIFDRPIKDISFGKLLARLFHTSREFNVVIQPQLLLLQKTLFNIEGIGRDLDPNLDLWKTGKPYLEKWMSEQLGLRALCKNLRKEGVRWSKIMPQLPRLLHNYLESGAYLSQTKPTTSNTMPAIILTISISTNLVLAVYLLYR
ncbi:MULTISPECIES: ubiquinone biosynthesis regulatory protein kinase UbiB [Candidatus Ichthyocystis]|uniref:Ubiquinone biosynthesis protein n=1 Tax=Candidatus Ichthyocystis hellenicum TaxID=1561003 RepID=A0A0S4M200_9BURK|nr:MULTISPECIES: ubiquinone biosynthesis regulatory protein kinase UbiB [Ichthyocystis]CUT17004.1 ubiquinone biosynthesis protein [Candidatus Ichthyocystis hellenicum]